MYAEAPCSLCGDNDGFTTYYQGTNHSESNGWLTVILCRDCRRKVEEQDGYSHHFAADRCPTCGHIRHLRFVTYKKGDKNAKQCLDCEDWFLDLEADGRCYECHKEWNRAHPVIYVRKDGRLVKDDAPSLECPGCGRILEQKQRVLPSGKQLRYYECWFCNFQSEAEPGIYVKTAKPVKVEAMF